MSSSKFSLPQTVQQPPPVCKKGPEPIAPDLRYPPSRLTIACNLLHRGSGEDVFTFTTMTHLDYDPTVGEWRGNAADGQAHGWFAFWNLVNFGKFVILINVRFNPIEQELFRRTLTVLPPLPVFETEEEIFPQEEPRIRSRMKMTQ